MLNVYLIIVNLVVIETQLKPIISENFKGVIWKILLDSTTNLLAIESRNVENKEVSFSVINYLTGMVIFKERVFEEKWLLNLLHIGHGHLYLSLFAGENKMFQSTGVIAVDIFDREIKWQNFTIGFWDVWQQGMKVYKNNITPKKFLFLDYQSGKEMKVENPTAIENQIIVPELSNQNNVMEAQYENNLIQCYQHQTDNGYQIILTVNQQDKPILEDILMQNIQKLQPETFFLQLNSLFYIRNKHQLVSYLL